MEKLANWRRNFCCFPDACLEGHDDFFTFLGDVRYAGRTTSLGTTKLTPPPIYEPNLKNVCSQVIYSPSEQNRMFIEKVAELTDLQFLSQKVALFDDSR